MVVRNKEKKRDRWISDSEYHAVYDLSSVQVKALMTLIYRTLQRPGDILKWSYSNIIEDENGVRCLSFKQSKTGRHMTIRLNDDIELAINSVAPKSITKSTPLLPQQDGTHYSDSGISSMFRRHVVASKVENFAMYDIKAKGATDMYKSSIPIETICSLCGHESTKTTEIYIKTHIRETVDANARVINRVKK
jgi:integrase